MPRDARIGVGTKRQPTASIHFFLVNPRHPQIILLLPFTSSTSYPLLSSLHPLCLFFLQSTVCAALSTTIFSHRSDVRQSGAPLEDQRGRWLVTFTPICLAWALCRLGNALTAEILGKINRHKNQTEQSAAPAYGGSHFPQRASPYPTNRMRPLYYYHSVVADTSTFPDGGLINTDSSVC